MSNPSASSDPFFKEAAAARKVYAFLSGGRHIVYEVGENDGTAQAPIEVVPFWSSRNRIKAAQKENPDFGAYEVKEFPLDQFSGTVLPSLLDAGVWTGANWEGRPPSGFIYPCDEFRALLEAAATSPKD